MRPILVTITTVFYMALSHNSSVASELLIKPHIDTGIMEYEFHSATNYAANAVRGKFNVSDLLPYAGGGVTAIYDRFFVDFYGQITAEGTDTGSQDAINLTGLTGGKFRFNSDLGNSSASVIAGYRIIENLTVIGGYRYSETDINLHDITLSPIAGIRPFSSISNSVHLDFMYNGPLFGLSYTIPIEYLKGALQINTAGTYLSGDVKQNPKGAPNVQYSGTSFGYNFGIGWTGRINDHFSYSFLADASKYDFNGSGNTSPDFSENIYRLRAQLSYSFGVGTIFGFHRL